MFLDIIVREVVKKNGGNPYGQPDRKKTVFFVTPLTIISKSINSIQVATI